MELTREEIAALLGLTSERVGQIERNAFEKIRKLIFRTSFFPLLRETLSNDPPPTRKRMSPQARRERGRIRAQERRDRKRLITPG